MRFDALEIRDDGIKIPRVRSSKDAGVEFSDLEAREIYKQACEGIIQ